MNFMAHLLVVSLLSVDSHIIRWTTMCHVKPSQKCVGHPGWHRKHPDGKQHPATKYPGCLPTAKKVCADDPGCVGVWGGGQQGLRADEVPRRRGRPRQLRLLASIYERGSR